MTDEEEAVQLRQGKSILQEQLAQRDEVIGQLQQEISGGFCSVSGTQAFCHIRGYLLTVRK